MGIRDRHLLVTMKERRNTRGKEGEEKGDAKRYMKIDIDKGDMVTGWRRQLIQKWGMSVKDDGESYAAWEEGKGVYICGTVFDEVEEVYERASLECVVFSEGATMNVVISFLDDVLGMVEYIDGHEIGTSKTEALYSCFPDWLWEEVGGLDAEGQDA